MSLRATARDKWQKLVERGLHGSSRDTLRWRGPDGLTIEPLYDAADAENGLALDHPTRPWRIAQRVDHPEPTEASALALADVEGGSNELVLSLSGAATARGFGVKLDSVESLAHALAGIDLGSIGLRIETAPFDGRAVATRMLEYLGPREHDTRNLAIDFGLDPVSDMARTGGLPFPWTELAARLAGTAKLLIDRGFEGSLARIDCRAIHEAGAGEAQELAFALATGVAYVRAFEQHGLSLERADKALTFLLVADADEFLTIAKFRAMRRLWTRVEIALGVAPRPIALAAETAWRAMTRRDPYTNMLRSTLGAFSAAAGGADSISILPFTAAIGLPDAFARRVARNLHQVLSQEAHLWRVADPASGSGALQGLTDELARAAWQLFQEIESEGGIVESLRLSKLQARIREVRTKRQEDLGRRKTSITGVSEFAILSEQPAAVLAPALEHVGPIVSPFPLTLTCEHLPSLRLAEPFERLRDRSDAKLAKSGRRPCVFLANLGSATSFESRRSFAKSLFEGGGIETIEHEAPSTMIGIVNSFRASGARIACLCSSDEVYAQQGLGAAHALKEEGAIRLGVVGKPGHLAQKLISANVDFLVFPGCDELDILNGLYEDVFEAKG